jgi:isocitrate/isopropylmalate dehydrogenase
MMLEHLGETDAAARITKAVLDHLDESASTSRGTTKMGTTAEIGDAIAERV